MKAGVFRWFETRSSSFAAFFAWQIGCDYRQCRRIKRAFFWQNQPALGSVDPRSVYLKGRRPTMNQFDGELSPPFEIVEPANWRAPIIFNSPHSGSVYPLEFLNASRIDLAALRRSEDSFMDELIVDLSERGFPTVRVNFPRSYVDVNREPYELDPRMFSGRLPSFANTRSMRVAGGLGTIPRVVGDGQEIYRERLSVD